jgi:hypothetical protein
MARNESFFQRLTRLFRSGPAIQRRVKGHDVNSYYDTKLIQGNYGYRAPAPFGFGRENSPFSVLGSYGILDRMARYAEFAEMEYTPEIASAMDIYADETVGGDDRGRSFHIYSDNVNIKVALEELFYDTLNVEFNLRAWTRNLVKYGDFFLYNEVLPEIGIINAQPIPVSELEREEGYDEDDPYAVRFKWLTRGNVLLENWQVTHFRILGNDLFLPYGTSVLEPGRRIWRQLIMMEDAMLVYRVVRSPERRVFYIDVANVAPNDVPSYMEAAKATLRSHSVIEKSTGRSDMRYNPLAVDEDYYIPVRGNASGTKIETLAGGQHVTATEDVQYIQSKLFAALKVPKPYLNYDENLSSKATLAQEDIRFSRTIGGIQKIMISELNKLAMIHLYTKGFDGEDLINFTLKLTNPSSIAIQQKLELWANKADVAGTLKDTKLVDERWIQKNVLELTDDDISSVEKGLYEDRIREAQLDQVAFESEPEKNTTTDPFNPSNYDMGGEGVPKAPAQEPPANGGSEIIGPPPQNANPFITGYTKGNTPIKATPFITRHRKNRVRRVGQGGRSNLSTPDFTAMLSPRRNKSLKDVFDSDFLGRPAKRESVSLDTGELLMEDFISIKCEPSLPSEVKSILRRLKDHLNLSKVKKGIMLSEEIQLEDVDKDEDEAILDFVLEEAEPTVLEESASLKEVIQEIDNETAEDEDDSVEIELG